ncbi:beta-galactosidase [Pseudarthrobacter sp. J1763]|uniref:beta-galactosidase n=1 Tax=Pseudarthrobacter sp. J1763 TaxID=3420445 RepID=UPI003D268F78
MSERADMQYVTEKLGGRIAFGGDYNPEQWPEDVWEHDVALMKEAGVNLVSVGIFSWALLEPEEGHYEFGWLDRVLDLLHKNGISVDLANASASPPPWFSRKYPDSQPVNADGVRQSYGSRQAFAACSPDYRRAAAALTTAIVDRYADHPAVVMWHVHNEYGCHNQPDYGPHAERGFQEWLQKRYGTLDALNEAWGTAFWSQHYYDWAEVIPPRRSGTWVNPTQQLDFARFSSDALLECFRAEADIIRARSPHPVTTNFMGISMGLTAPIDYWRWSEQMDLVSNDHYLMAADERNYQELAMVADLTRGWAKSAPWLLMEHSSSAVNWQPRNVAKAPGEMLRNSLQHVARGTDGVLFFQWRASRAGAEKFHSGLLPHAGRETKVWRETVQLGKTLEQISELAGSRVVADAVIIHDTDARWASELDSHPSVDANCVAETRRWHDALYRAGVTSDFRQSSDDLSGYKVAIVPMQYLITEAGRANLEKFVASGGTLVVSYFSGIVDENDHIIMDPINGGGYPGAFAKLLGVSIEEFFPLREGAGVALKGSGSLASAALGDGVYWSELGAVTDAEVLATFDAGATAGSPAITRRAPGTGSAGTGAAYYVATTLNVDASSELLKLVLADAGLSTGVPAGARGEVDVVVRRKDDQDWLFVINHGDTEHSTPAQGTDLISGTAVEGTLNVPAGGFAVVRLDTNSAQ